MTPISSFSFTTPWRALCAGLLFVASTGAPAHVSLPAGGATAGSDYEAAFRVGHACKDAAMTTGVRVRLPKGFVLADAQPKTGWKTAVDKTGDGEVHWTAVSPRTALPAADSAEFILRGRLPAAPGTIYFKVLQECDRGSADWAQLPGATGEKLDYPAARLDLLPPGRAAVEVKNAWVRQTVPGQSGTGAFMTLSAPSGARLVGAATPAAGGAEVHEMKMDGDTMRMRPVQGGLELPARQQVELKPSGLHIMLTDLRQPLTRGSTVPLKLDFEDARGARSSLDVQVPVGTPASAAAEGGHRH